MKVFISWSGSRSKALAIALKDWIPLILQYVKPWVSEKDISAGERWAQAIAGELESSNFGILCVTPENISSEWILFEAGALSKSMLDSKVIPILFGLELSDLRGPLSQFQALKVDQQGIMEAIKAINAVSENKASEDTINQLVPVLWHQLQDRIDNIPNPDGSGKQKRPQSEILEELVSQVRGLDARLRESDADIMERENRVAYYRMKERSDLLAEDFSKFVCHPRNSSYSLLMIAGYVREKWPWLAEIILETHREIKNLGPEEASNAVGRLVRFTANLTRGGYPERLIGANKFDYGFMAELPRLIDRSFSMNFVNRPDDAKSEGGHSDAR